MLAYALLLFIVTISAFGLAYIVGASEISRPLRERWAETARPKDVFGCNACMVAHQQFFSWSRDACSVKGGPHCPNGGAAHDEAFFLLHEAKDPFLLRLVECPACLGTWIGLMLGVIVAFGAGDFDGWARVGVVILSSLYICGTNFLLARATGLIPNPSLTTNTKE